MKEKTKHFKKRRGLWKPRKQPRVEFTYLKYPDLDPEVAVECSDSLLLGDNEDELEVDPILLTRIGQSEPVFTYKRPNGTAVVYRLESLVDYMLIAGKFHEPESHLTFSDQDLKDIDRLTYQAGLDKESVYKAKYGLAFKYAQIQFDQNAAVGLERCCGELVGRIPDILTESETRDEGQIILLTEIFPHLRHYFMQLEQLDSQYAHVSLKQFAVFIEGPPNRPYIDEHELLPLCFAFFDELAQ